MPAIQSLLLRDRNNERPNYSSGVSDNSQLVQHARLLCSSGGARIDRRWRRAGQRCQCSATVDLAFGAQGPAIRIRRFPPGVVGSFNLSESQRTVPR